MGSDLVEFDCLLPTSSSVSVHLERGGGLVCDQNSIRTESVTNRNAREKVMIRPQICETTRQGCCNAVLSLLGPKTKFNLFRNSVGEEPKRLSDPTANRTHKSKRNSEGEALPPPWIQD
jgi:hypothetical protein